MWEKFKSLPAKYKAGSLFILVAIIAMLAAWYDKTPTADPNRFTAPPAIKGTADIPKVDTKIAGGTVKVIPKKEAGKKIPLPDTFLSDPKKELVATGTAPASETPTDILATIDTTTGDVTLDIKPKPQSLMAFENKLRLGIGYGIGSGGNTAKVFGEWGFARVGSAHVAVQAEIVTTITREPEAKAMGIIYYAPTK